VRKLLAGSYILLHVFLWFPSTCFMKSWFGCVMSLQCDQPGDPLCYAQLQDAPQGQREGGSDLQNSERRPTTPGNNKAQQTLSTPGLKAVSLTLVLGFLQTQNLRLSHLLSVVFKVEPCQDCCTDFSLTRRCCRMWS